MKGNTVPFQTVSGAVLPKFEKGEEPACFLIRKRLMRWKQA